MDYKGKKHTTSSVVCVLVRSVLTVFDAVTNQRLEQTLGSVPAHKLHVASTQRVCGSNKEDRNHHAKDL